MKTLKEFPDIGTLKRRMQSLSMLDALLFPEWEYRYFSFNKDWSAGEAMGSIRNGSGDDVFVLFSNVGCFIKEFYHERPVSHGAYICVPPVFREATREPASSPEYVTACYWRTCQSNRWEMSGNEGKFDPETSFLLAALDGNLKTYTAFLEARSEKVLPSDLVAKIFKHHTLTASIADGLGYSGSRKDLKNEADEIGCPSSLL